MFKNIARNFLKNYHPLDLMLFNTATQNWTNLKTLMPKSKILIWEKFPKTNEINVQVSCVKNVLENLRTTTKLWYVLKQRIRAKFVQNFGKWEAYRFEQSYWRKNFSFHIFRESNSWNYLVFQVFCQKSNRQKCPTTTKLKYAIKKLIVWTCAKLSEF